MVVGLVLAVLGGFALRTCASRGWVGGTWLQIPVIALALLCFGLAQWLGGSGFIASFVGGLTFGALTKHHKEQFLNAAEGVETAAIGEAQIHEYDVSLAFFEDFNGLGDIVGLEQFTGPQPDTAELHFLKFRQSLFDQTNVVQIIVDQQNLQNSFLHLLI